MIPVRLSRDAANYVRREADYLRRYSPIATRRFSQAIKEAKRLLQNFPEAGNHMHGLQVAGDRTLVSGDYLLRYSFDGFRVNIVSIRHGRTVVQTPDLEDIPSDDDDLDDETSHDPNLFR
jgi:plasmid stabilization system protein ParE